MATGERLDRLTEYQRLGLQASRRDRGLIPPWRYEQLADALPAPSFTLERVVKLRNGLVRTLVVARAASRVRSPRSLARRQWAELLGKLNATSYVRAAA